MIDPRKLLAFLKKRSAGTEDATEYDGFLSYPGEWHALIIGLGTGFTAAVTGQPIVLAGLVSVALGISGVEIGVKFRGRGVVNELRREPWYGVGAGILAYLPTLVYVEGLNAVLKCC